MSPSTIRVLLRVAVVLMGSGIPSQPSLFLAGYQIPLPQLGLAGRQPCGFGSKSVGTEAGAGERAGGGLSVWARW